MKTPRLTIDDVRQVAMALPRTEEHLIHGRVKFRVRSIVYVAFSRDQKTMGFAFPKELRSALVDGQPDKFSNPKSSELRFNWVCVRLDAIDASEMRMLVSEAWRMVVPRRVAAAAAAGCGTLAHADAYTLMDSSASKLPFP